MLPEARLHVLQLWTSELHRRRLTSHRTLGKIKAFKVTAISASSVEREDHWRAVLDEPNGVRSSEGRSRETSLACNARAPKLHLCIDSELRPRSGVRRRYVELCQWKSSSAAAYRRNWLHKGVPAHPMTWQTRTSLASEPAPQYTSGEMGLLRAPLERRRELLEGPHSGVAFTSCDRAHVPGHARLQESNPTSAACFIRVCFPQTLRKPRISVQWQYYFISMAQGARLHVSALCRAFVSAIAS